MPNLVPFSPDDPLMQPVRYNGQEYFTSQYFHRQYQESAGLKGKHQRHDSFRRLLRSIEAYALYVEQGDIVELRWEDVKGEKSGPTPDLCRSLRPLFQATGYYPLILLNATAPVASARVTPDRVGSCMTWDWRAPRGLAPVPAHRWACGTGVALVSRGEGLPSASFREQPACPGLALPHPGSTTDGWEGHPISTDEPAEAPRRLEAVPEISTPGTRPAAPPAKTVEDRRRQFEAYLRSLEWRMEHTEAITEADIQEVRLLFREQWAVIHAALATAQQRLKDLQRGVT